MELLNLSKIKKLYSLRALPMGALFIFFSFLAPSFATSLKELSQHPQWLNLYRYHHIGPNNNSTVINDSWFFHPKGRKSPFKELKKAVEILSHNKRKRCLFPARTLFLKTHGLLPKGKDSCPQFEYFMRKLQLKNIWIVFASYYINNPSSAFGHTLFKIEGIKNEGNDFLEYGANFSAIATTSNPLAYSILGLIGGFRGYFGLLPYFIKIREYNDSESRDLWEYKLNLTREEKKLFLAHLWEMDQAKFRYYYLTENCSYHLLTFLDAIRPEFNFKKKLPYFVFPSETLTIVAKEKNLIGKTQKRPSQFNLVQEHFQKLPQHLKNYWKKTHDYFGKELSQGKERASYLDFIIDYLDLIYGEDLLHESSPKYKGKKKITSLKREIQTQRSQLPQNPKKEKKRTASSRPFSPEKIHPPRFISLSYDFREYHRQSPSQQEKRIQRGQSLQYRFSFHELMDNPLGAPPWTELVLGSLTLRRQQEKQRQKKSTHYSFDQFTLLKVQANQKRVLSTQGLSWLLEIGGEDYRFSPHHDFGPYAKGYLGHNWQWSSSLLKLILPLKFNYSSRSKIFPHKLKLELGPKISLTQFLTSWWRLELELAQLWRKKHHFKSSMLYHLRTQWDLTKKWALSLNFHYEKDHLFSTSGLRYYF